MRTHVCRAHILVLCLRLFTVYGWLPAVTAPVGWVHAAIHRPRWVRYARTTRRTTVLPVHTAGSGSYYATVTRLRPPSPAFPVTVTVPVTFITFGYPTFGLLHTVLPLLLRGYATRLPVVATFAVLRLRHGSFCLTLPVWLRRCSSGYAFLVTCLPFAILRCTLHVAGFYVLPHGYPFLATLLRGSTTLPHYVLLPRFPLPLVYGYHLCGCSSSRAFVTARAFTHRLRFGLRFTVYGSADSGYRVGSAVDYRLPLVHVLVLVNVRFGSTCYRVTHPTPVPVLQPTLRLYLPPHTFLPAVGLPVTRLPYTYHGYVYGLPLRFGLRLVGLVTAVVVPVYRFATTRLPAVAVGYLPLPFTLPLGWFARFAVLVLVVTRYAFAVTHFTAHLRSFCHTLHTVTTRLLRYGYTIPFCSYFTRLTTLPFNVACTHTHVAPHHHCRLLPVVVPPHTLPPFTTPPVVTRSLPHTTTLVHGYTPALPACPTRYAAYRFGYTVRTVHHTMTHLATRSLRTVPVAHYRTLRCLAV